MNVTYNQLRAEGHTFEQMAAGNLDAMLKWKLGPLSTLQAFFSSSTCDGPQRFAMSCHLETVAPFTAWVSRGQVVSALVERFPAVAQRTNEFWMSEFLRCMPSLRYPALLRAALAASPSRQTQPADELAVEHRTRGFSRCDIVTADQSMAHLLRTHEIVPASCALITSREGAAGIISALDAHQTT